MLESGKKFGGQPMRDRTYVANNNVRIIVGEKSAGSIKYYTM